MDIATDDNATVDEPRTKKKKKGSSSASSTSSSPAKAKASSSSAAPTASDLARKLHRKKDLLLRKTLAVALAGSSGGGGGGGSGSSNSPPTDQSCVVIDLGGPSADGSNGSNDGAAAAAAGAEAAGAEAASEITVQSIAEILAARLSLPRTSPSLRTTPTQKSGIVAYCGQCYVRASQEIKTIREGRERREQKRERRRLMMMKKEEGVEAVAGGSTASASDAGAAGGTTASATDAILNSHDEELIAILNEIQTQVVSYAASSLLEADLFELGTDGPAQLVASLRSASIDPTNGITMNVAGSGSSFYAKLCEELNGTDASEFGRVIGEAVVLLSDALAKCETVAEGGGGGGDTGGGGGDASPLVLVNALSALCGNKAAAAVVASHPTFLLPPAGSPAAAERITPPQPTVPPNANQQQAQFYRMMAALTRGHRRGYDRRSGPALERDTIIGRAMKIGCPKDDPDVLTSFANMGGRSKKDSDNTMSGLRSQLTAYQVALNGLVKTLITAGAGPRGKVRLWSCLCVFSCVLL